jgi:hypothetical protein
MSTRHGTVNKYHHQPARTPLAVLQANWIHTRQIDRQALRKRSLREVWAAYSLPRRVMRSIALTLAGNAYRDLRKSTVGATKP